MADLVFQCEERSGRTVYHLAVMKDGAITGYTYDNWPDHLNQAHYLCVGTPPKAYDGWDLLTVKSVERINAKGYEMCLECLGLVTIPGRE